MPRRSTAVLCALVLGLAPAVLGVPSASAAPADCGTDGYPFQPDATVLVARSDPRVGEHLEVGGSGFCGNDTVTITIGARRVGAAVTAADGSFDPPVTVPGPPGRVLLCAAGAVAVTSGHNRDCVTIAVLAARSAGPSPAMTGVQIALLVLLAAVLLGAGAVFVAVGRSSHPPGPAS